MHIHAYAWKREINNNLDEKLLSGQHENSKLQTIDNWSSQSQSLKKRQSVKELQSATAHSSAKASKTPKRHRAAKSQSAKKRQSVKEPQSAKGPRGTKASRAPSAKAPKRQRAAKRQRAKRHQSIKSAKRQSAKASKRSGFEALRLWGVGHAPKRQSIQAFRLWGFEAPEKRQEAPKRARAAKRQSAKAPKRHSIQAFRLWGFEASEKRQEAPKPERAAKRQSAKASKRSGFEALRLWSVRRQRGFAALRLWGFEAWGAKEALQLWGFEAWGAREALELWGFEAWGAKEALQLWGFEALRREAPKRLCSFEASQTLAGLIPHTLVVKKYTLWDIFQLVHAIFFWIHISYQYISWRNSTIAMGNFYITKVSLLSCCCWASSGSWDFMKYRGRGWGCGKVFPQKMLGKRVMFRKWHFCGISIIFRHSYIFGVCMSMYLMMFVDDRYLIWYCWSVVEPLPLVKHPHLPISSGCLKSETPHFRVLLLDSFAARQFWYVPARQLKRPRFLSQASPDFYSMIIFIYLSIHPSIHPYVHNVYIYIYTHYTRT